MTRNKLKEHYPDIYGLYKMFSDENGLWEEVLMTFEANTVLKEHLTRNEAKRELNNACFEWDF
jgi:hypothetical protein